MVYNAGMAKICKFVNFLPDKLFSLYLCLSVNKCDHVFPGYGMLLIESTAVIIIFVCTSSMFHPRTKQQITEARIASSMQRLSLENSYQSSENVPSASDR